MGHTRIAFASVTYAEKGKTVLSHAGILAKIVRLEPWETEGGCAFGLFVETELPPERIRQILDGGHVRYGKILPM